MTAHFALYQAYGLVIASEIDLSELPQATAGNAPDVTIRLAKLPRDWPSGPEHFSFSETVQCIDFQAVGKFEIRGLTEILVEPKPGLPEGLIKLPLLGSVFALLLQLRGAFVMHASAVHMPGGGVAFLGDKRAGKSTTAAAMIHRGYPLITDDVLALTIGETIGLTPGFPQIKLTGDSERATKIASLGKRPPVDFPGFDKHQHNITNHFSATTRAPLRLYQLTRADRFSIERASETDAFQVIMRFSYLVRFGKGVLATKLGPIMLRQAAELAKRGLVRTLTIVDDISRVEEIASLVEHDVEI